MRRESGKAILGAPSMEALGIIAIVLVLSTDKLLKLAPPLSPLVGSSVFPFFLQVFNIIALGVILLTAYRYGTRLALVAILIFVPNNILYMILSLPKDAPEIVETIFIILISLLGIWFLDRMRRSEEKFYHLFENSPTGIVSTTYKGDIVDVNKSCLKMHGYNAKEEFARTPLTERFYDTQDKETWLKLIRERSKIEDFEARLRRKNGTYFWASLNMLPGLRISGEPGNIHAIQDITEVKRIEKELINTNRLLKMLSQCNQALVRLTSESQLLDEICRIIVDNGGYRMAWIGFAEQDALKSIRPVAQRGADEDYLYRIKMSWADDETGRGPTGTAIQTNIPSIVRDIPSDLNYNPWREEAVRRGFASSITLPLGNTCPAIGALNIYAANRDAFDTHEINLLTELSHDLSYGIEARRLQKESATAQEALSRSEKDLAEAQRIAQLGSWDLDLASNTLTWSAEVYRMFGLEPDEFQASYDTFLDLVHPEDREMVNNTYMESLSTRTPYDIIHRLRLKDGSVRYVNEKGETFYDNGMAVRSIGTVQDVTERKQFENKLERAAREWRTTFDSASDPISIQDINFNLTRVNLAYSRLVQMEPREIIGKKCYELLHCSDCPVNDCPQKETFATGKPARIEIFEPFLNRHLEITTSPIFNTAGEVDLCVHITRDITERKKIDEQLMFTDRMASIGQLASGIAHELNNPLTGVIGFSELLLEREVPDDFREDLITINNEARRTANIVRGLLTFSRKQTSEKEFVDINNIILDVLRMRSYEQKVTNIEVKTQFDSEISHVMGNGPQLQQVFFNLIINAEQAMTEARGKGTLNVTTVLSGTIIKVSVIDDGPGISTENMRRLFTPFFTTKEAGKGTGLGLSICHGIITQHGGRIYAESEFGRGAAFIIELPLANRQTN